jgi:hypothetical protein
VGDPKFSVVCCLYLWVRWVKLKTCSEAPKASCDIDPEREEGWSLGLLQFHPDSDLDVGLRSIGSGR